MSGFYKDQASEYSNMSRTGENFAANMIHNPRRSGGVQQQNQDQQQDHFPPRDVDANGQPHRIYGSANRASGEIEGEQDIDDLSDWERHSHRSGRSAMS